MKNLKLVILTSTLAMLALSACTKKRPYEEVLKEEVQDRSAIDTNSEYLYSSSMDKASRSSSEAMPYFFGMSKRVKLKWTKESLQIVETEKDARFQNNHTNDKLVLEIPVEYLDYECAKNSYGECTNKEKTKDDVTWDQKSKFKFKLEGLKTGELDLLPILDEATFGSKKCHSEVSSKVVGLNVEKDALNMRIQKTYKVDLDCMKELRVLSDATVTAVFHYSLVKTSSVLSKGFKTRHYPTLDKRTFGFFSTQRYTLDADNNAQEVGKTEIMNHWNPNRSEIVYYLSEEFNKPHNRKIRDLTYKAFDTMNQGLAKANVKFRMKLKDNSGQVPGDIRNSMIVLVEDPMAKSVLGYGPQTEDPVTGEIISANTIMYLGTLKKYVKMTYEEILDDRKEKLAAPKSEEKGEKQGQASTAGKVAVSDHLAAKFANLKYTTEKAKAARANHAHSHSQKTMITGAVSPNILRTAQSMAKNSQYFTNAAYAGKSLKAQYKYLHEVKNCGLERPEEGFASDLSPELLNALSRFTKPWDQLSESDRQAIIDLILPVTWYGTLLHELGHNLGLRHNFKASEDKANFYSNAELRQMGVDRPTPFSSVMDYGDDLKTLTVLGKYDIAALRFAYANKVENSDGKLVDIEGTLQSMVRAEGSNPQAQQQGKTQQQSKLVLKEYGYCTDENADVNAGCRRHDLGTSIVEIMKNDIATYYRTYKARNTRQGRLNMSVTQDQAYADGVFRRFKSMRVVQEVYERILELGIPENHEIWEKNEGLKDIKEASYIAGDFFLDVLRTPDVMCVGARADDPEKKVASVTPLAQVDPRALSCFDVELTKEWVLLGQIGKHFNSKKDPNSDNAYADQIDVRGYWIDKLMAARALFRRKLGDPTFDSGTMNFADREDMADQVSMMMESIILNQMGGVHDMTTPDGQVKKVGGLPTDLFTTMTIQAPLIERSGTLSDNPASLDGIPNEVVHFNQLLAAEIAYNMDAGLSHAVKGRAMADKFRVTRYKGVIPTNLPANAKAIQYGTDYIVAMPSNSIAMEAIEAYRIAQIVESVDKEALEAVIAAKKHHSTPLEGLTPEEEKIWQLDDKILEAAQAGLLKPASFFEQLLLMLPHTR